MEAIPAKVILFGEYALLKGGNALGIPLPQFSGNWSTQQEDSKRCDDSRTALKAYANWLSSQFQLLPFVNLEALKNDLNKGLWFASGIPTNAGLGSSGALVAGLLKRYGTEQVALLPLVELKRVLANFERFFHGTSSGIDPLICFVNQPVHIGANGQVQVVRSDSSLRLPEVVPFLLPVSGAGHTGKLVQLFHQKCSDPNYLSRLTSEYIPVNNGVLQAFLNADSQAFWLNLHRLSALQLQLFPEMLDASLARKMEEASRDGAYGLKLCGSGGGGFALGFARTQRDVVNRFPEAIPVQQ